MNWIDRFIGFFSPQRALQREIARKQLEDIGARAYEAASYGSRTNAWFAPSTSATSEAGAAVVHLRNRSRELVRNNPWAGRAVKVLAANVVGSGIQCTITASASGKGAKTKADRVELEAKRIWKKWAKRACDFNGRLSFVGLQAMIMRAVAESGEVLILKQVNRDNPEMPLQLRLLEGDWIDHSKHTGIAPDRNGEFDFFGVRFDANGRRLGLWLYEKHPAENNTNMRSRFVTDNDVIHIFEQLRPDQARGVPMGVAGFLRMRDFDQYEDAQLIRQKVAACFSVFVRKPDTAAIKANVKAGNRFESVEPGTINYLAPGEDVSFAAPPSVEGYESYSRSQLRAIAAAYGITYEALTNDLSNVNFSSGRMGWIEMHRQIQVLQRDVLIPALDRVWDWFTDFLAITGRGNTQIEAEWTTPKREMIDPVKEVSGLIQQVRAGLLTQQEALRMLGYDPEDTLAEMKLWYELVDSAGVLLATDLRVEAKAANFAGDGVTNPNSA